MRALTPLHLGGPVPADGLLAVFHGSTAGVESAEIAPGLFVSSSAHVLPMIFSGAPGPGLVAGRLVFGYSGWSAGQLEHKRWRRAPGWRCPYAEDLAFSARVDDLWRRSFEQLGLNPALLGGGDPAARTDLAPARRAMSGIKPVTLAHVVCRIRRFEGSTSRSPPPRPSRTAAAGPR